MIKFTTIILLFCFLFFSLSCLEVVNLDLPTDERLVVEGSLRLNLDVAGTSNAPNFLSAHKHTITLSLSKNYLANGQFGNNQFEYIKDAIVKMTEEGGRVYNFTANLHPDSVGEYSASFLPIQGKEYKLSILYNGEEFEATDRMPTTDIKIDSIYQRTVRDFVNTSDNRSGLDFKDYNVPVIVFTDPTSQTDYYDFGIVTSRNNFDVNAPTLALDFPLSKNTNRTDVLSDEAFNGKQFHQIVQYEDATLLAGDGAAVSLVFISKPAYEFEQAFVSLTTIRGLVDPPKPPLVGNVKNLTNTDKSALGFFKTVAFTADTLKIN